MAICSCHVINVLKVRDYLARNGAVLTEKAAKAARADLHNEARAERVEEGLAPNPNGRLCGTCADRLLEAILRESAAMYPEDHKEAA